LVVPASDYDLKLKILRVCGLLDSLMSITQKLEDIYSRSLASISSSTRNEAYEKRIKDILSSIELISRIVSKSHEKICAGEASYMKLYEVYTWFDKFYTRIFTSPLPGQVRQLYYEIFYNLKTIISRKEF
jgi:hypothetical protein